MASSRFPGKVLAPLMGRPMLAFQIERLRRSVAEVVVATTELAEDDPIEQLASQMGVRCVRGPSQDGDLIGLHAKVARETDCDVFVLSGADDPLLEASTVNALAALIEEPWRYAETNTYPLGMNAWAWDRAGMEEADAEATAPEERQHVRPWFVRRPHRYPAVPVWRPLSLYEYRLTVDTGADLELIRRIVEHLWPGRGADFDLGDVLALLDAHAEWLDLNADQLHGEAARAAIYDLEPVDEGVPA